MPLLRAIAKHGPDGAGSLIHLLWYKMKCFGHYSFARWARRLNGNLCFRIEEVGFSFNNAIERGIGGGQGSEIAINTAYGTQGKPVKAVQLVTRRRRKAAGRMWRLMRSHRQHPCHESCHVGRQTAMHSHKIMGRQLAGLFSQFGYMLQ